MRRVPLPSSAGQYRAPVAALWIALAGCSVDDTPLMPELQVTAELASVWQPNYDVRAFDVPTSMGDFTSVLGVNNLGIFTGNYAAPDGTAHGFVFQDAVFTDVVVPGAGSVFLGSLGHLNEDGVAIGSYTDADDLSHTILYEVSSGQITFVPDPIPNALGTDATGLNSNGTIVGVLFDSDGVQHGFIQEGDEVTLFDHPNGTRTRLFGINDRRQIVGQYFDGANIRHGFLREGNRLTPIDVPGSTGTAATAINNRGQIIGFYRSPDFTVHGFLLEHGRFTTVDFPGSTDTRLTDISELGVIAGTYDFFSRGMIAVPVRP